MRKEPKGHQGYKSPKRKLIAFFKKSRDQWKEKYKQLRGELKRLSNQLYYAKKSKDVLKTRIKELDTEVRRLRSQAEIDKKKGRRKE